MESLIIDCDGHPFTPKDWKVVEHQQSGILQWDPSRVTLFLSEAQLKTSAGLIVGHQLRTELASKHALNANVLDQLIAYPVCIPRDTWKAANPPFGRPLPLRIYPDWMENYRGDLLYIMFFGTIYSIPGDSLCVRFLCYNQHHWTWGFCGLDNEFADYCPAAILEQQQHGGQR